VLPLDGAALGGCGLEAPSFFLSPSATRRSILRSSSRPPIGYFSTMQPPAPAALAPQGNAPHANEEVLFEGSPSLIPGLGSLLLVILTVGLALIVLWAQRGGTKYRITSQRVIIDKGLFSKTLDQLDLYRINDFVVERPFSQRVMGTGNIKLKTLEKANPEVDLVAIPTDVVELYEKMRKAVEASKQQRSVRLVEYE
jgi:hypothetical protein